MTLDVDPESLEGSDRLAYDLALLAPDQYRQVAEWMVERGWTEPLDTLAPAVARQRRRAALLLAAIHELHVQAGRMSKVRVEDVALVLGAIDHVEP